MSTETWTQDGARFVVVSYDERGVAEITREALHVLLVAAGWRQQDIPEPEETARNGRELLREVAASSERAGQR